MKFRRSEVGEIGWAWETMRFRLSCNKFSKLNSHRINAWAWIAMGTVTRPRIKWKFRAQWFPVIYWIAGSGPSGRVLRAFIGYSGSNLHRVSIESTRLRENRPHFPIPEFGLTVSFDAVSQPLPNEITPQDPLRVYGYAGSLFLFCHSNFPSRTTRSDTLETISSLRVRKSNDATERKSCSCQS